MASQRGYLAENSKESKTYNRTGSGEKPLATILERKSERVPNLITDNSEKQGFTPRQPPQKWELVGLAEKENDSKVRKGKESSSHASRGLQSSRLCTSDNSSPPQLPPRRRNTEHLTSSKVEGPALPPRNTSAPSNYYKQDPGAGGFVNSRKGGFSGDPKKWKSERSKVSRTGRVACAPPTLGDKWVRASETLSLLQFVEKYSIALPAEVRVEKGHYGSNDPETVGNEEKLIISYVKSRKLLNIMTSTGQKYSLPLGSAVQLSLLYNPNDNEEKALHEGYTFQSVGDLVSQSPHLPKIVCASKAYMGDSLKSTVYANELLLVKSFSAQTEKLHVISIGQNPISKFLSVKCNGYFTTKPSQVRMYVSDIDKYIGTSISILELQAELDLRELKRMSADTPIDKSLGGVVKVSGFVTERSLLATRITEGDTSVKADHDERKVFEIPVNDDLADVELTIIQKRMPDRYLPHPSSLESELELWNEQDSTATTKTQRLFDDFVRHGLEREGLAYNAACNVYDEPHTPSASSTGVVCVTPNAAQDLLKRERNPSNSYESDNVGEYLNISTNQPQDEEEVAITVKEPLSDSDEVIDEHLNDHGDERVISSPRDGKQSGANFEPDLKTVVKSVVSEMMSEYQKSFPDRGAHNYLSKNPNEGKAMMTTARLNEVVLELSEIENLWYIFGIRLGVKKSKLDQIFANYGSGPSPSGRCFIETISYWENNHENVTWSSIVDALYSMEKKQLAKKVAKKHGVMLPDPNFNHDLDDFAKQLKEFIPEDRLPEISSRQQQMQEKDHRLHEVQERLGEYEQTIEEYHNTLMDIKNQLLFNERFTRMLTRENQLLRMKQAHKEKQIRSPSRQDSGDAGQGLRKEIHVLHEAQETYETRLQGAHHDTMELQHKLFSIENQMKGIKQHLFSLQDQKYQLTRGLREEECELSSIITDSISKDSEESNDDDEELPQYYNIIRCDGRVEVKLHEEELKMLQQELDRKTAEVGTLKKELQTKNDRMAQVGSLLAKQECDEMAYSYADATELNVLEKHHNDHLKTRLQMEKIDCQIQLTRAWLQKRDVEMKLGVVKQCLDMSKDVCQRAQELFEKSTNDNRKTDIIPPANMDTRSFSLSSTASEESVFSNYSRSSSLARDQAALSYISSRSLEAQSEETQAGDSQINTADSEQPTQVTDSFKKSANSVTDPTSEREITEEHDGNDNIHNNGNKNTSASIDTTSKKIKKITPHSRTRSDALASTAGQKRSPATRRSTSSTVNSSQNRRPPSAQGKSTHRLPHKTKTDSAKK